MILLQLMRAIPLALLISFLIPESVFAQDNLCQGAYWTEQEGERKLNEWARSWSSKDEWEVRKNKIRRQLMEGMQWNKMPQNLGTPAVILHSKKDFDGYSVENIAIESFPGFYVTGNLYRPLNSTGKNAAILCPHGHWNEPGDVGRFRNDMQLRCASFAKLGAIVFAYDMVGYGESQQVTHHIENALLLQTWNSKRIIDYLISREDVDSDRLAITGASGGGTQSFMITALDNRIAVSAPVVMVSAHFFGGCVCESGMPIHQAADHQTNNVEIAGLAAPRPMLIISNGNDWTANNPEIEFPYLQRIYSMYQRKYQVRQVHLPMERHDYGLSKRSAMYSYLARELHLDIDRMSFDQASGRYDESFATLLKEEDLNVFNEANTRPSNMLHGDKAVLEFLESYLTN